MDARSMTARDERAAPGGDRSATVSDAVEREVERFLYREARLLDQRRFHEWVDLFADDARYWMPVRADKLASEPVSAFAAPTELAHFDETKETLAMRASKLDTGMAWAEEPRSRTRHLITNVEVEPGEADDEVIAYSSFLLYRTRLEMKQDLFVGARVDVLRREAGAWRIVRRTLFLDQTVLSADNLSVFF